MRWSGISSASHIDSCFWSAEKVEKISKQELVCSADPIPAPLRMVSSIDEANTTGI